MSRGTDPGHFFQTYASLTDASRKATKSTNNLGRPIRLPSKLLAVIADPRPEEDAGVFVAESAGCVRRVGIDQAPDTKWPSYTGPQAPLTSLTLSPDHSTLFAGCWDKTVWSWNARSRKAGRRYEYHDDFVKCVTTARIASAAGSLDLLISGSADASIAIWTLGGERLHVLKPGGRGVLDLAVCPAALSASEDDGEGIDLFTAHSSQAIHQFRLSASSATPVPHIPNTTDLTTLHETSVDGLTFTGTDDALDLWTASADKTARGLSYDTNKGSWVPHTSFAHPDFVRAVLPMAGTSTVVTACRDENVYVWDADSGDLHGVLVGHFEEVTGLCAVGERVVSVSIDGSVRVWRVDKAGLEEAKAAEEVFGRDGVKKEEGKNDVGLTEEEERELAELMEED